jgi:uncharacterized phiE125 gp8 family phage protein
MPTATDTRATTLFSLDVVRAYVGASDASKDDVLIQLADAVSERVEAYTARSFVSRTAIETLDGDGSGRLFLASFPIVSMTSLTIRESPGDTTVTDLVEGTDYDVDDHIGVVQLRFRSFTKGFQNIVATYVTGHGAKDAATIPADVYQAALDYVKLEWQQYGANAIAATSVSLGPSTFLLKPGLPWGIKQVLDQWQARTVL